MSRARGLIRLARAWLFGADLSATSTPRMDLAAPTLHAETDASNTDPLGRRPTGWSTCAVRSGAEAATTAWSRGCRGESRVLYAARAPNVI